MKNFFELTQPYKFEWNDLRAIATIINVVLIITIGLTGAWFGLGIAVIGVVKDLTTDRRINGLSMHLAMIVLNSYFLFFM